jgi:glycosyltransferase involved in cell wall biosynthesis
VARPIVIVSFSYAPRLNPRAFRWTALAERFAALGHPVDVVTSWLPGFPDSELRNGVRLWRAGWKLLESARGGIGGARTSAPDAGASAVRSSPIASLGRRLWRNLCWPDVSANWYFPALKATAALLATRRGAALISVAPMFTAVAVGHALKRRDPGLDWIIDLGDPFSFLVESPPNNQFLYARLNARFERAAFRAAHAVAVTTRRTAERYGAVFPESASKISVIPPLLSAELAPGAPVRRPGAIRIVFLGRLYRGVREPDFLLALFAAAQDGAPQPPLDLHFYGETGACAGAFELYRERCRGRLFVHGVVSRERALAATREADVLVNLGNQTPYQLPSKVVEYAATGKPVVNIAPHREDSSIEFFQSYPQALNLVSEGRAPDAAQVARFREFVSRSEAPDSAALEGFMRPFRIEQVAGRYLELIGAERGR